jgi:hypothetical protein
MRVDLPIENLVVVVAEDNAIPVILLGGSLLRSEMSAAQRRASDADIVAFSTEYRLDGESLSFDGMVELRNEDRFEAPVKTYSRADCLAYPPGGESDRDDCRHRRGGSAASAATIGAVSTLVGALVLAARRHARRRRALGDPGGRR